MFREEGFSVAVNWTDVHWANVFFTDEPRFSLESDSLKICILRYWENLEHDSGVKIEERGNQNSLFLFCEHDKITTV